MVVVTEYDQRSFGGNTKKEQERRRVLVLVRRASNEGGLRHALGLDK